MKSKNNKVRNYTDKELLGLAQKAELFKGFPKEFFLVAVRSKEDTFNVNDDKFYLYNGAEIDSKTGLPKFIMVCPGTTNPGKAGLYHYDKYNKDGVAVLATNIWMYDLWYKAKHNNKVMAWCQIGTAYIHRDGDKDEKSEESGPRLAVKWKGLNFHPQSYINGSVEERTFIDGWSVGCQCPSIRKDFDKIMEYTENQKRLSYLIIQED